MNYIKRILNQIKDDGSLDEYEVDATITLKLPIENFTFRSCRLIDLLNTPDTRDSIIEFAHTKCHNKISKVLNNSRWHIKYLRVNPLRDGNLIVDDFIYIDLSINMFVTWVHKWDLQDILEDLYNINDKSSEVFKIIVL